MSDGTRSCSIASRSARPGPTTCSWPTKSSSVGGRSRCASGADALEPPAGGLAEEVAHARKYALERRDERGLERRDVRAARGAVRARPGRAGRAPRALSRASRVLDLGDRDRRSRAPRRARRRDGDGDRHRRADAREGARRARRTRGSHDRVRRSATSSTCPYDDASFDVLASNFGLIFAPDHANVAAELARVARPGGRLGFTRLEAEPEARRALPPLHRRAARRPRGLRVGPRGPRRGHARRGLRARVRRRHALDRGRVRRGALGALLRVGAAGDRAARAPRRRARARSSTGRSSSSTRATGPRTAGSARPRRYLLVLGRRK